MREVINRKIYDTETAKKIIVCDTRHVGKHVALFEDLYRKRNGEFFLLIGQRPNPLDDRTCADDGSDWNVSIEPLSQDEAREWVDCTFGEYAYERLVGLFED